MQAPEINNMLQESRVLSSQLRTLQQKREQKMTRTLATHLQPFPAKPKSQNQSQLKGFSADNVLAARAMKQAELVNQAERALTQACPFKPTINPKSATLAHKEHISKRPLPQGKKRDFKAEKEAAIEAQKPPEIPIPAPIDPNYYQKQLEWAESVETKNTKSRLEKAVQEFDFAPKSDAKPKDPSEFLQRVEKQKEKKKKKREKLEKKYNAFDFKPKINRNFADVEPVVGSMTA